SRVRLGLHLVLSDVQSIGDDSDHQGLPCARLAPRLESAAMVFTGELRAVHDLLYRPQDLPDGPVLESLLGSVAAALNGFVDLRARLAAEGSLPPILAANLAEMRRLAGEICGDCVPRDHTPALRAAMDRVQERAGRLLPEGAPA